MQIWGRHHRVEWRTRAARGWAIPAAIVRCESDYQNDPPNSAGASGYLQIIPSTWVAYGGARYAPEAYEATREQQDAVAARLYREQGTEPWSSSESCWG